MLKIFFLVNIISILFFNLLNAKNLTKIIVEGNERISTGTIKVFADIKLGIDIDDNDLNNILKKLYETNFFEDVKVNLSDNTLIINVIELPIVQTINLNGIKKESLEEGIYKILKLKNKSPYREHLVKNDIALIKETLKTVGYYFVTVKVNIVNNTNNTIDLDYNIDLGEKAKIKKITFSGNKIFKNRELRNIIISEEDKFWKFLSNKKYLNKNSVKFDKKLLNNFYKNNGYFKAVVSNSSAALTDNKNFILNFNIDAGNKYKFNELNLILPRDFDEENFSDIIETLMSLKGKIYSISKIEKILKQVDKITLSKQYEFIKVEVSENTIDDNKINLDLIVSESKKFYVEKINIIGNSITEETVIRNKFVIDEGDAYNEILHNKSINNIKAQGIFGRVESKVYKGSTDQMKIITIDVDEKATGEISAGAGYGTSGGTIGFTIRENNYLGKGIRLNTSLNIAADSVQGSLKYVEPNYKNSSRDLNTSIQSTAIDKLKVSGFKTSKTGASIGTSFERYEDFYFSPTISVLYESLETNSDASASLTKQKGNYFDTDFKYGVSYDMRDQKFQPKSGYLTYFSQTLPIISKDYSIENLFTLDKYVAISEDVVTKFSFLANTINSANNDVRISKRLRIPSNRLRGFESGKVGPKDSGEFIGGNYVSTLNISTNIPQLLPNTESLAFNLFFDVANVWSVDYDSKIDQSNTIRSSTGIAIDVYTPIGPLAISFAQPITKSKTDILETFRFNIGTNF